jgi:hypothetical protein
MMAGSIFMRFGQDREQAAYHARARPSARRLVEQYIDRLALAFGGEA